MIEYVNVVELSKAILPVPHSSVKGTAIIPWSERLAGIRIKLSEK
jgi:hypothetical protein